MQNLNKQNVIALPLATSSFFFKYNVYRCRANVAYEIQFRVCNVITSSTRQCEGVQQSAPQSRFFYTYV